MLCCAALRCAALCCAVLCCAVLWCGVVCCAVVLTAGAACLVLHVGMHAGLWVTVVMTTCLGKVVVLCSSSFSLNHVKDHDQHVMYCNNTWYVFFRLFQVSAGLGGVCWVKGNAG